MRIPVALLALVLAGVLQVSTAVVMWHPGVPHYSRDDDRLPGGSSPGTIRIGGSGDSPAPTPTVYHPSESAPIRIYTADEEILEFIEQYGILEDEDQWGFKVKKTWQFDEDYFSHLEAMIEQYGVLEDEDQWGFKVKKTWQFDEDARRFEALVAQDEDEDEWGFKVKKTWQFDEDYFSHLEALIEEYGILEDEDEWGFKVKKTWQFDEDERRFEAFVAQDEDSFAPLPRIFGVQSTDEDMIAYLMPFLEQAEFLDEDAFHFLKSLPFLADLLPFLPRKDRE